MELFQLSRANDVQDAIKAGAASHTAQQGADVRFLAGGTTLLDLMKLNVERPGRVVDISRLPLNGVDVLPDGGMKIGATMHNADLAHHALIRDAYPVLSQALLAGASAQHGDDGRQPVATHQVCVFPRHPHGLQQA